MKKKWKKAHPQSQCKPECLWFGAGCHRKSGLSGKEANMYAFPALEHFRADNIWRLVSFYVLLLEKVQAKSHAKQTKKKRYSLYF